MTQRQFKLWGLNVHWSLPMNSQGHGFGEICRSKIFSLQLARLLSPSPLACPLALAAFWVVSAVSEWLGAAGSLEHGQLWSSHSGTVRTLSCPGGALFPVLTVPMSRVKVQRDEHGP